MFLDTSTARFRLVGGSSQIASHGTWHSDVVYSALSGASFHRVALVLGEHSTTRRLQVRIDISRPPDCRRFILLLLILKESLEESMWEARAEARSAKRQRKLNQLEIPEDHVLITDDLLGKGGFGEVFVADYNGRNAAAKVSSSGSQLHAV